MLAIFPQCSAEQTIIQEADFKLSDDGGEEPVFSTTEGSPSHSWEPMLGPLTASPQMPSSVLTGPVKSLQSFLGGR